MNKLVTKQIYKMSGVPTPRGTHLTKETKDLPLSELGYYLPLVVKPCENGSSIGVYICHTEEEYNHAVRESFERTRMNWSLSLTSKAVSLPVLSLPEKHSH